MKTQAIALPAVAQIVDETRCSPLCNWLKKAADHGYYGVVWHCRWFDSSLHANDKIGEVFRCKKCMQCHEFRFGGNEP